MTKLINVLKFFFSNEREIAPGVFWLGGTLFENRNQSKGEPPLKFKKYMKPEFPKARLIREDFLPERDSMDIYRIKKKLPKVTEQFGINHKRKFCGSGKTLA